MVLCGYSWKNEKRIVACIHDRSKETQTMFRDEKMFMDIQYKAFVELKRV